MMSRGCCDGRGERNKKFLSFLCHKNDGDDVYMDEPIQARSDLSFILLSHFLFFPFYFFSPFLLFFSFLSYF
jgi:hypothetical protein